MSTKRTANERFNGALAFMKHDAASGIVLLVAALLALLLQNSPAGWLYDNLLHTPATVGIGSLVLSKSLLHWINDGLMAIFFFLVGLEIKRELIVGELSTRKQASLPLIAAVGGMLVPALIYASINWNDPIALQGWAIPAATDIAFAVGVLALLGPRVPTSLKVFLLALAIIDDLGAIIIIAFFYTAHLSLQALALAGLGVAALIFLNRKGVTRVAPYALVGFFIWLCVLKSGVHATLAGVVTALAVPLAPARGETQGTLERLEESLHPWVAFGVLPLFAFANAGVSLAGMTFAHVVSPIPMGIALGLFIGKPIGIFGFSLAAIGLKLAGKPEGATWAQVFGVAILGGIGFTMSLFIGMLAFADAERAAEIRIGVLLGSLASAIVGYWCAEASQPAASRHREVAADYVDVGRRTRPGPGCRCLARGTHVGCQPLLVLAVQVVPLDGERSTCGPVLLVPVGQQIETGVIDVVELVDMHVHLRTGLQDLELRSELRQPDQGRRALQVEIDAVLRPVLLLAHVEMREGIEQLEQRQPEADQHALQAGSSQRWSRW